MLEALLDNHADEGVHNVGENSILKVPRFSQFGTPMEIAGLFGGKQGY